MHRRAATFAAQAGLVAALALAASPDGLAQPQAAAIGGYVTVTSDYRNRGLSQSRGEPSLQLGADFQHATGFFAGARAASVEYASASPQASSRQNELSYYAGYTRRVDDWSLTAGVGRYAYPDSAVDYDYGELSGSVGYRNRIFLTASYTDDLFGRDESALNGELSVALPLARDVELGAGIGRFESDGLDYSYWNVGVSKLVARVGLDLRYHDNDLSVYGPFEAAASSEWVLSLSYGFDAR